MLVYRLCNIDEVNKLLNERNLKNVVIPGTVFIKMQQTGNISSHNYNFNCSYLHFFKDFSSIFYYYTADKYICTYDIPEEVLSKYEAQGFYKNVQKYDREEAVSEYAIPSEELDFSYLQKIDQIKEYIDLDDYLTDPSLKDEIQTIYLKEKERSRTRKIS